VFLSSLGGQVRRRWNWHRAFTMQNAKSTMQNGQIRIILRFAF
jgi:hypothetical protein